MFGLIFVGRYVCGLDSSFSSWIRLCNNETASPTITYTATGAVITHNNTTAINTTPFDFNNQTQMDSLGLHQIKQDSGAQNHRYALIYLSQGMDKVWQTMENEWGFPITPAIKDSMISSILKEPDNITLSASK